MILAMATIDVYARTPTPATTVKLKSTYAQAIHALTAAYAFRTSTAICVHVCPALLALDASLRLTIAAQAHAVIMVFAIAYRTDSLALACLVILASLATYLLTIAVRIHAKMELHALVVCHCPTCTYVNARQASMDTTVQFSLTRAV